MTTPADSPLVRFYEGRGPDHRGRALATIQAFNHHRLESIHDYIQWLFPLREPSAFNPFAPLLTDADVAAFHDRPALRDALRRSFEIFLDFLGLTHDQETGIVLDAPGPDAAQRREVFSEPNHNWLRITRVLTSLNTLGLPEEARAFFTSLEARYHRRCGITDDTFAYLKAADKPQNQ
jgi:hypothetical protein